MTDSPNVHAPADDGLLRMPELLARLRISYSTYRALRAAGKAPPEIKLSRRSIRFSVQAVEAWERAMQSVPAQASL